MAQYKISGIWKDSNNVITHYAMHLVKSTGPTRASKKSKAEAVSILDAGHSAVTWIWNYRTADWNNGEKVEVVNGSNGRYLRSSPDERLTDNLGHLINFDWITG